MADGDGFHVLEFLENNPAWNVVPRLMFSNSAHDDDVRTAYMLGAVNSPLMKDSHARREIVPARRRCSFRPSPPRTGEADEDGRDAPPGSVVAAPSVKSSGMCRDGFYKEGPQSPFYHPQSYKQSGRNHWDKYLTVLPC